MQTLHWWLILGHIISEWPHLENITNFISSEDAIDLDGCVLIHWHLHWIICWPVYASLPCQALWPDYFSFRESIWLPDKDLYVIYLAVINQEAVRWTCSFISCPSQSQHALWVAGGEVRALEQMMLLYVTASTVGKIILIRDLLSFRPLHVLIWRLTSLARWEVSPETNRWWLQKKTFERRKNCSLVCFLLFLFQFLVLFSPS